MKKSITIAFPSMFRKPAGGAKVPMEYANRLSAEGFEVYLAFPFFSVRFDESPLWKKPIWFLARILFYFSRRKFSCKQWFPLDDRVKEIFPHSLQYRHMPKTNLYIATSISTAPIVNDYPIDNDSKFYFIQDYETWGTFSEEEVRKTYHYPMNKIVISTWLKRIMDEEGETCHVLVNGFDFNYFNYTIPYEQRNPHAVAVMYHDNEHKGFKYVYKALKIAKQRDSQLIVKMFGVKRPPFKLPEWVTYYQTPDRDTFNHIYNSSAVYVAASVFEGWGLTVGEAMICGAAVVCTDIDGFKEMVTHDENALLSPICNPEAMADNIIRLINDNKLRIKLADNGRRHIQKFNWDSSYSKLKKILGV